MLYIYIYIYVFSKKNILYNSYLNRNIFKKKISCKIFFNSPPTSKNLRTADWDQMYMLTEMGDMSFTWMNRQLRTGPARNGSNKEMWSRNGHEKDGRSRDEQDRRSGNGIYDQWSGDAIWSDIDPKKWRWRPGHGNLSIRAFCSTKWTKQQNGLDNYQLDRTQEVVSQDKTSAAQDGMDNQAHDPLVCYIGQMTKSG